MHDPNALMLLAAVLTTAITFIISMLVQCLGLPAILDITITTVLTLTITLIAFIKLGGLDRPLYDE